MSRSESQKEKILRYMQEVGPINPKIAENMFGCTRLAARIAELRKDKHIIIRDMEEYIDTDGQKVRYASYYLKEWRDQFERELEAEMDKYHDPLDDILISEKVEQYL